MRINPKPKTLAFNRPGSLNGGRGSFFDSQNKTNKNKNLERRPSASDSEIIDSEAANFETATTTSIAAYGFVTIGESGSANFYDAVKNLDGGVLSANLVICGFTNVSMQCLAVVCTLVEIFHFVYDMQTNKSWNVVISLQILSSLVAVLLPAAFLGTSWREDFRLCRMSGMTCSLVITAVAQETELVQNTLLERHIPH